MATPCRDQQPRQNKLQPFANLAAVWGTTDGDQEQRISHYSFCVFWCSLLHCSPQYNLSPLMLSYSFQPQASISYSLFVYRNIDVFWLLSCPQSFFCSAVSYSFLSCPYLVAFVLDCPLASDLDQCLPCASHIHKYSDILIELIIVWGLPQLQFNPP